MLQATHYIPVATTVVALSFAFILFQRWNRKRSADYLLWWAFGVLMFAIGTATEAINAIFGWSALNMKTWYISGALFGAFPLAQGTVYLLFKKRTADIMGCLMLAYCIIAALFVTLAPVNTQAVTGALTGKVLAWGWVRALSPLPNTYGLIFLVGGAIWSAVQYARKQGNGSRVLGNWLIALGGLLPGIGGAFTRFGFVEASFVTELLGILFIWGGYYAMTKSFVPSIHAAQQPVAN